MKILRIFALGLICSGFANQLQASDVEIALSSDTAQFTFRSDSSLIGWGGADLGIGLFYNEEDDLVGQFSLMQSRSPTSESPLTLGVGAKTYFGRLDVIDDTILAIAIGGEIRYTIPGEMPMAIYLNGYLAPDITSFSDTEGVKEYTLGFQIEIMPQTTAFIGIQSLETDTDHANGYELDDDKVHLGVRMTF